MSATVPDPIDPQTPPTARDYRVAAWELFAQAERLNSRNTVLKLLDLAQQYTELAERLEARPH